MINTSNRSRIVRNRLEMPCFREIVRRQRFSILSDCRCLRSERECTHLSSNLRSSRSRSHQRFVAIRQREHTLRNRGNRYSVPTSLRGIYPLTRIVRHSSSWHIALEDRTLPGAFAATGQTLEVYGEEKTHVSHRYPELSWFPPMTIVSFGARFCSE